MLENRSLKRDVLALGLCALAIFLAAALLTYDPADPPSTLVYPPHAKPQNVCGPLGAAVSSMMLNAFGFAAYYVVLSLVALDAVLLLRRPVTQPLTRFTGWLLSLIGLTSLMAMTLTRYSPGPVIGPGGYLGAAGRGLLEMHFAEVGGYILTSSLILGGWLLATDYFVIYLLAWTVGRPTQQLGRGVIRVGSAYAQRMNRKRSDLDAFEEFAPPAKAVGPTVKISGRPEEPEEVIEDEPVTESESTEEAEAAIETEDDALEAEPKTLPPKRSLASMLGIARPKKAETETVLEEIDETAPVGDEDDYELPPIDLLLPSEPFSFDEQEKDVRRKAKILEKTFADFGYNVRVVEIQTGPVIAQFEVELEAGLRLSKITVLADDLAIALRVPSVRIVAPIPGKNTVGVEVPNSDRQLVRLREVMEESNGRAMKMRIPLYLGKDVAGAPMFVDLASLPHLLIAGRTGTGKSVCLNSIICSMLMTRRPDEVRMLLIDPKMVELSPYKSIPHLMHPVVTDMKKAEAILGWAVEKMEERYHLLARAGVRHISNYNQLGEEELMDRIKPESPEEQRQIPTNMPYIVIVADELADLMMTAAKEVESHIIRLAQKSRAVGIHLVLATQKPTVDVITGLIKSNLPARICFQVASRTDSRVVLDEMGADKLLGNGDMLFLWPGTSMLLRGQGTYLSDDEINNIIGSVATTEPQFVKELVTLKTADAATATDKSALSARDELYEAAIDVVVREGRGSVSLLQRALGVGYGRAARLIDFMAEDGIVGTYNGSQAREVLLSVEDWEARNTGGLPTAASGSASSTTRAASGAMSEPDGQHMVNTPPPKSAPPAPPAPVRRNKIRLAPPRTEDPDDFDDVETDTEEQTAALAPWEAGPKPFASIGSGDDTRDDAEGNVEDFDHEDLHEEDYDEEEEQGELAVRNDAFAAEDDEDAGFADDEDEASRDAAKPRRKRRRA